MRHSLGILFFSVVSYACVAHSGTVSSNDPTTVQAATPSPLSIHTCMWTWNTDGATEFRYVVDVNREEVGPETTHRTPANQVPDCAKLRAERKKRDAETYNRIVERLKNQQERPDLDANLVETLQWIEQSTKWGALTASWIVASPNGAHAVITARNKPLLLIDIATLQARVLVKAHAYLRTPVAWAPDSRLLAFAPPDTDKLHIYNIEQRTIVSTKAGTGPWVETLSWSPDTQRIAAFGFHDRRMNKTPLGLLGAIAGHPEYRNDGVLSVYWAGEERRFSVVLRRGISELSSPNIEIEWK